MNAFLIVAFLFLPFVGVFAATVSPPTDFKSFLGILTGIIDLLIVLIFSITFITIAWGVVRKWIMGDPSSEDIESGKKIAFVGVIALVVMISIWGILNLLQKGIFG